MEDVIDLLCTKLEEQKKAKENFWHEIFPGCSDEYIEEKKNRINSRIAQLEKAIKILSADSLVKK